MEPSQTSGFCKDYKGFLVTDSFEQYHLLDKKLPDVTNANCWTHARRAFTDVVKTADKRDSQAVRNSVAYQVLQKIADFYNPDIELEGLLSEKRLQKRQEVIRSLVEEFFVRVKQQVAECTVPPKTRAGQEPNFFIN
ncbi:MAG: transposase [Thermoflexaceae bacterium]|nr:transposase [Thermoflexaceae bacterium]